MNIILCLCKHLRYSGNPWASRFFRDFILDANILCHFICTSNNWPTAGRGARPSLQRMVSKVLRRLRVAHALFQPYKRLAYINPWILAYPCPHNVKIVTPLKRNLFASHFAKQVASLVAKDPRLNRTHVRGIIKCGGPQRQQCKRRPATSDSVTVVSSTSQESAPCPLGDGTAERGGYREG